MRIKKIHVEASTFCNARCPLCPRNLYGYKVEGVYPEIHLAPEKFKECLDNFPHREYVYFNGNLGDPMMNPRIIELAKMTKCYTEIFTNGSIGKKETWLQLAELGVVMVFSVDGLQDTNHLYRQDVEWQKVTERMEWFISAGGKAHWKFVLFDHNSHQTEQARQLADRMGFKQFEIIDHGRNYGPALDKRGNITHWILPADGSRQPGSYDVKSGIERYRQTHDNRNIEEKVYEIDCEHLRESNIYIDARGRLGPCCYQGFDLPDLPFRSIEEFEGIRSTWKTKKCDPVCASSCGLR